MRRKEAFGDSEVEREDTTEGGAILGSRMCRLVRQGAGGRSVFGSAGAGWKRSTRGRCREGQALVHRHGRICSGSSVTEELMVLIKTIELWPPWCWPILVWGMSTDEGPICLRCHSWCYVTLLAPDELSRSRGYECSSLRW